MILKPFLEIIPMAIGVTFVFTILCIFIDDYFQKKEEKLDG